MELHCWLCIAIALFSFASIPLIQETRRQIKLVVLDFSAERGGEEMFGEWVELFVPNVFPV